MTFVSLNSRLESNTEEEVWGYRGVGGTVARVGGLDLAIVDRVRDVRGELRERQRFRRPHV